MLRRGHVTAPDGCKLKILPLLPHFPFVLDFHRLPTLLPNGSFGTGARCAVGGQPMGQPVAAFPLDLLHEIATGEALEIPQRTAEIGRRENRVEMPFENDPRMDL